MRRGWLSKLASGSTYHARCIRGAEHGDARFATASLSDQHADALQKTSGYRMAHSSRCCGRFSPVECVQAGWFDCSRKVLRALRGHVTRDPRVLFGLLESVLFLDSRMVD